MSKPIIEMPDFAQKSREQLVSGLKQGQQLSVDAVQAWIKAVTALPVLHVPTISDFPALPDMETATRYALDVVTGVLSAQRQLAVQLTKVLPGKTI